MMDLLFIAGLFLPGLVGVYWLGRIVGFEHGAAWGESRNCDLATEHTEGTEEGIYRPIAGGVDVPGCGDGSDAEPPGDFYSDPDWENPDGESEEEEEKRRIEALADAECAKYENELERHRLLSGDMVDDLFEGDF